MSQHSVAALDGAVLGASLFEPNVPVRDTPAVLINSATGVRRRFYHDFASFLSTKGFVVATYDYRGIGDSRPPSLRGYHATMRDWGTLDLAAMIDWLGDQFPERPVRIVAHSVGGQLLGLAPNADRVTAMLAVGAQSGWWGHWPRPRRYANALLWYVLVPGLSRALGYFPSRRLGLGEDLPAGVALEWARWCRNRDYMVDERGTPLRPYFDRFTGSLLALSIDGDPFAPRASVAALVSWYANASIRLEQIDQSSFGLSRLGHFGFFRAGVALPLWSHAASWLLMPGPSEFTSSASVLGRN
ncbi:MAG: alpha/beta fold hydrolase [Gemmatimonadaceae bacterium]